MDIWNFWYIFVFFFEEMHLQKGGDFAASHLSFQEFVLIISFWSRIPWFLHLDSNSTNVKSCPIKWPFSKTLCTILLKWKLTELVFQDVRLISRTKKTHRKHLAIVCNCVFPKPYPLFLATLVALGSLTKRANPLETGRLYPLKPWRTSASFARQWPSKIWMGPNPNGPLKRLLD